MKLSQLEVDTEKENRGDWVESPEFPGLHAKVRALRNTDFQRAQQVADRKLKRKYGNQPIPPEEETKKLARLVVDHVLLDISGLEDEDGSQIELTREFAFEIMTDPKYRKLADFIVWASSVVGENINDEMEDDMGNSAAASSGKQAGDSTRKR